MVTDVDKGEPEANYFSRPTGDALDNACDDVKLAAVSRDVAQPLLDPIKMDAAIIAAGKPQSVASNPALSDSFTQPTPPTTPFPFPLYHHAPSYHYLPGASMLPFQNMASMPVRQEGFAIDTSGLSSTESVRFDGWANVPSVEMYGHPVLAPPSPAGPFEMVPFPLGVPLGNTLPLLYPSPSSSPGLLPPMRYCWFLNICRKFRWAWTFIVYAIQDSSY